MKTQNEMVQAALAMATKYHNEGRWTLATVWQKKAERLAAGAEH